MIMTGRKQHQPTPPAAHPLHARPLVIRTVLLGLGLIAALVWTGSARAAAVEPVFYEGNLTCAAFAEGSVEYKIQPVEDGSYSNGELNISIDVRNSSDGQVFDWSEVSGGVINRIFVKGGPDGNLYDYTATPAMEVADTGLHSPINPKNGRYYGLSHISFCYTPGEPSIAVTKSCDNPQLSADETSIIYRISGSATNDGVVPLYNATISDSPVEFDGGPQYIGALNPGDSANYQGTITVPLASNGEGDMITVTANTESDGSGSNIDDTTTATCPSLQISPALSVSKDCNALVEASGGIVAAKVAIHGTVCNVGEGSLFDVVVTDNHAGQVFSIVSLAAPADPGNPGATDGACADYSGAYLPDSAQDFSGNDTTAPGEVVFKDTVTATALDLFGNAVTPQMDSACCPLCPGNETCTPGAQP